MLIEIETKDEEGALVFHGKLNATEASFVLNVGINYLLAHGCMPTFSGADEDNPANYPTSTTTTQ